MNVLIEKLHPRRFPNMSGKMAAIVGHIAAWKLKQHFELPDGWAHSVYDWLSQHLETEIENVDDQGGWPSEEALKAAFLGMGYLRSPAVEARP